MIFAYRRHSYTLVYGTEIPHHECLPVPIDNDEKVEQQSVGDDLRYVNSPGNVPTFKGSDCSGAFKNKDIRWSFKKLG